MGKLVDLTGQRFGKVTVIERAGTSEDSHATWRCKCDCGREFIALSNNLRCGRTKSCGCEWGYIKHGDTANGKIQKLHVVWSGMKQRCNNTHRDGYKNYGGRGITVCPEWRESYTAFRDWALANGYQDGLSIDRIDVNGDYCPENCRWITMAEQQRNKRNTKHK